MNGKDLQAVAKNKTKLSVFNTLRCSSAMTVWGKSTELASKLALFVLGVSHFVNLRRT